MDDCPPRLNIDFAGSFCCGFVAVLFPLSGFLFKLLKNPPPDWDVLLLPNILEAAVFIVDVKLVVAAGEACGLLAPNARPPEPPDGAVVVFVPGADEVVLKLAKGLLAA